MNNTYVVATIKDWNIEAFKNLEKELPGEWILLTDKSELTSDWLEKIDPRYIFFPHWSWIVPKDILERWECVCFHMADVPYGRGGSPLQNLIVRGHQETKISALRMVQELDAGPVYYKVSLSLHGSAQDIFERMAPQIMLLAERIAREEPEPVEQVGKATCFKRRTPEQSELLPHLSLSQIYDHIRMLDADTYPNAFFIFGDNKLSFKDSYVDEDGSVVAKVTFSKSKE